MKIIAIALITFASACTLPAQYGAYGPRPQPPQAAAAQPQASGAPGDSGTPTVPGLDDAVPADLEYDAEGTLMAAPVEAWVTAPLGNTLCFAGRNPFLSEAPMAKLENKTNRLWLNYTVNEEPVIVLVPGTITKPVNGQYVTFKVWRRQDNGYGNTVLGPGKSCYMETGPVARPTFMAYGYLNIGSKQAPKFRPQWDFEMPEPETVRVSSDHDLRYPLNDGRFQPAK